MVRECWWHGDQPFSGLLLKRHVDAYQYFKLKLHLRTYGSCQGHICILIRLTQGTPNLSGIVNSLTIAACGTVFSYVECTTLHSHIFTRGKFKAHMSYNKRRDINMKRKNMKESKQTRRDMEWAGSEEAGARIVANEKAVLDHTHLHNNSCNIIGSKMCPIIWKVGRFATWHDG